MKSLSSLSLSSVLLLSCSTTETPSNEIAIDEQQLLNDLQRFAHDSLEGRGFGTVGNYKAQLFP